MSQREWKTNLRPSVTCFFPASHPLCNQHSLRHRIISYGYISTICPDVTRPGPPPRNVVRYRHPQRTKPFTKNDPFSVGRIVLFDIHQDRPDSSQPLFPHILARPGSGNSFSPSESVNSVIAVVICYEHMLTCMTCIKSGKVRRGIGWDKINRRATPWRWVSR